MKKNGCLLNRNEYINIKLCEVHVNIYFNVQDFHFFFKTLTFFQYFFQYRVYQHHTLQYNNILSLFLHLDVDYQEWFRTSPTIRRPACDYLLMYIC